MMTLTQLSRPTMPCTIAAYHALDSMVFMIRTANTAERRDILEQLLEYDVIEVCLDVSQREMNLGYYTMSIAFTESA